MKKLWNWIKPRTIDLIGLILETLLLLVGGTCFIIFAAFGLVYTFIKHIFVKRDYSLSRQATPIVRSLTLLFDGFANACAGEFLNDAYKLPKRSPVKYGKWYQTISAITGIIKRTIRDSWFRRVLDTILGKEHCERSITPEQEAYYLK